MLSEHTEFNLHQIVWATVQKYPAWPAKITRKLNQHGKTVYKLNFFGDPSYCYLHSHSLGPFSQFDSAYLEQQEHDQKLKKAFELAKFYFSKQLEKISITNTQSSNLLTQLIHPLSNIEETKIQSKENIYLPQKTQQLQFENTNLNDFNCLTSASITPQNVLQVVDHYHKTKNSQFAENLNRKQIICFQNDLKSNLLLKYNLNAVDNLKYSLKSNQPQSNLLKQKRLNKRQKKSKQPLFGNKQLCMRKIHKILIQKGIQRHSASSIVIRILQLIQNSTEQKSINNEISFKQSIVRILLEISSKIKQIQEIQLEYLERQILSLIDCEIHIGNKIQEGLSRTTQMCDQFII